MCTMVDIMRHFETGAYLYGATTMCVVLTVVDGGLSMVLDS